jgi:hypothetical protein
MNDNEPIADKIQRFSKGPDQRERESAKKERIKSVLQKFNYNHQVKFKATYAFSIADGNWLTKDEQQVIDYMERERD